MQDTKPAGAAGSDDVASTALADSMTSLPDEKASAARALPSLLVNLLDDVTSPLLEPAIMGAQGSDAEDASAYHEVCRAKLVLLHNVQQRLGASLLASSETDVGGAKPMEFDPKRCNETMALSDGTPTHTHMDL